MTHTWQDTPEERRLRLVAPPKARSVEIPGKPTIAQRIANIRARYAADDRDDTAPVSDPKGGDA